MKIADYFYCTPDRQWDYAAQLGVRYAAGRMPDGQMERTAGSFELLREMKERFEARGFSLKVIEPAPPNQKIKQGLPGRDEEIERMCTLIRNMGRLGIEVLCYNFVAYFNWERSRFDYPERGGALVSEYDFSKTDHSVPTPAGIITEEQLWRNFEYMQRAIVPAAEEAGTAPGRPAGPGHTRHQPFSHKRRRCRESDKARPEPEHGHNHVSGHISGDGRGRREMYMPLRR